MSNIILIHNDIENKQQIIDSLSNNTHYFLLNNDLHLDHLKQNIANLNLSNIENVGIIQHGFDNSIVINSTVKIFHYSEDLNLSNEFILFFKYLKDTYSLQNLDIIACNMLDTWVYTFTKLEELLSISIRASNDNTGNLKHGGNWIQESDDINIKNIYFTDEIDNYIHLFYNESPLSYSHYNGLSNRNENNLLKYFPTNEAKGWGHFDQYNNFAVTNVKKVYRGEFNFIMIGERDVSGVIYDEVKLTILANNGISYAGVQFLNDKIVENNSKVRDIQFMSSGAMMKIIKHMVLTIVVILSIPT